MSLRRAIHLERDLDAPPEGVFAVVADHANYTRFDGVTASTILKPGSPDPNGLGAVRQISAGPLRFDEEITAYEPGRRMDYLITKVRALPFRHTGGSIRFTPTDTGTHVVWTSAFEVPLPVLGPLIDRALQKKLEESFDHILTRSAEVARAQAQPA